MVADASSTRARRPSADATRQRILAAALELFADRSYDGATTRDIAERAGVSQPSVNYHFRSKLELWRAAVDGLFAELRRVLAARLDGLRGVDDRTCAELVVREFIAFSAAHPQLHRLISQESKTDGARIDWLVDEHVRPLYESITELFRRLVDQGVLPDVPLPYLYYVVTGAGPTIFVHAPECRRLAGIDPFDDDVVATHADVVVGLLFGRPPSGS